MCMLFVYNVLHFSLKIFPLPSFLANFSVLQSVENQRYLYTNSFPTLTHLLPNSYFGKR